MQATTPKTTRKRAQSSLGAAAVVSVPLLGFAPGAHGTESAGFGVNVGLGYSDNIALVPTDPRSELIAETGLDFALQRVDSRLNATATGDFSYLDYLRHTYSSQLIGRFDGLGTLAIIPDRLVWTLQDDFGQAQLDPFTAVTPTNLQNINYLTTGPDLTLHLGPTGFIVLSARYARATYETSPFDSNGLTGAIALGRQIAAREKVSLNVKFERLRFQDSALQADANLTSVYGRYEAQLVRMDVTADLGATRLTGPVGPQTGGLAHFDATRKLSAFTKLTLSLAHELTDASDSFSNFRAGAIGGIPTAPVAQTADTYTINRASVRWSFERKRTTVTVSANWERDAYDRQAQLDLARGGVEISAERKITPHFSALVHGSYYRTSYTNIDFLSNDRLAGGSLKWRIGRDFNLFLRYDHTVRDASGLGVGYRENRAFLSFEYRPPTLEKK